jgi:transposase
LERRGVGEKSAATATPKWKNVGRYDYCSRPDGVIRYLAKDLLPEVRMKDKTQAQIASLTQTRDTMVKLRTALKNKINNLCSAQGVNLNKEALGSEKGLRAVLEMRFDGLVNLELKIIVEQIRSLNKSIAELEETIAKEGQNLKGHANLTSIKGIGGLSGSILLSIIGDIHDFPEEGNLAAYFGIVPRISNSNETEHSGRITKRGTKLGRTTLIQMCSDCAALQPVPQKVLRKDEGPARHRKGDRRSGTKVFGNHLSNAQEQLGVRRLSQLCIGGRESPGMNSCLRSLCFNPR